VLRYGTRSQGISQFYLHTPCTSANGMNLPSQSWYSFTDPRGMEGRVGLVINNMKMVPWPLMGRVGTVGEGMAWLCVVQASFVYCSY